MVHHQSRERRCKLSRYCDICLVLILSSQCLQGEVCCLDGWPNRRPGLAVANLNNPTANDTVPGSEIKKLPPETRNSTSPTHHTHTSPPFNQQSTSTLSPKPLTSRKKLHNGGVKRKIVRRQKEEDDMTSALYPFPVIDEPSDGSGLSSQYSDDYLEDGLEIGETPDSSAAQVEVISSSSEANQTTRIASEQYKPPTVDEDIEQIVRSQINMAATNWATLKPEEYRAPSFNDTLQGLDLASYLTNFTDFKRHQPEHDHAIPEDSAVVKPQDPNCVKDLFYPNHNYKYDQETSGIPFKLVEDPLQRPTADPMTASSDESNKYGSMPEWSTTQSPHVEDPNPKTRLANRGRGMLIKSNHRPSNKRPPTRIHPPPFERLNKNMGEQEVQMDRPTADATNQQPLAAHSSPTSFKNVPEAPQLLQEGLQDTESQRIPPPPSPTPSPLNIWSRKHKKVFHRLRPIELTELAPNNIHTHYTPNPNLAHLSINGSLAARLNANRYKNWPPLKPVINATTTKSPPTNLQKLLQVSHFGIELPPLASALDKLQPATIPEQTFPPKTSSWFTSSSSSPSSSKQPPLKPTTPMAMMTATKPTVAPPEVMLRSGSLKTNASSSPAGGLKAMGSRAHFRQPAHHHHHHSHVHQIKPSVISIPISVPALPKYGHHHHQPPPSHYYDSLLATAAAAAASAAAANSHKLSRQQVLAQSLLSRPTFARPEAPIRLQPPPPPLKKLHHPPPPPAPPGTIPIGGTLASTRGHPKTRGHQKPASGGGDDVVTTYHSGLFSHLLETANKALKQVAGNTASLLNLQAAGTGQQASVLAASTPSTTHRGSTPATEFPLDYFPEPHDQLDTIGLYQAPTDDTSPLGAYLAALLASTSDLFSNKFKQAEPSALASITSPTVGLDWPSPSLTDFGNQTSDSSGEVMFASLGDNTNLLYPILTASSNSESSPSGNSLTKGALVSLLEPDGDQSELQSNTVSAFDSPRHHYWSKPLLEPPGKRIIPLNKHSAKSNKTGGKVTPRPKLQPEKLYQEELQHSSHHYPETTKSRDNKRQPPPPSDSLTGERMPYAVTHYIGETTTPQPPQSPQSPSKTVNNKSNLVYSLVGPGGNERPKSLDYFDINFGSQSADNFRPVTSNQQQQHGNKQNSGEPLVVGAGGLDGPHHQFYTFSEQPYGTKSFMDESKKSHAIRSLLSGLEDYRANESKDEEHMIQIMPQSSLQGGGGGGNHHQADPLQTLMHLASGGLKPSLMAASDIVNYHKLKLIDHYLQHHVHGGHDHMSEAARLSLGGHSHKAQLMLAFWPIIIAIIPIMIIVAIVVQLVLAAPLVLFAMTTLTVARFVSSVFGPMFTREDLIGGGPTVQAASMPFGAKYATSARPKLAAVPSNNFLYSMLKMETKPSKRNSTTTSSTTTTTTSTTSTTSKPQRRRKKRSHLRRDEMLANTNEWEDYFESMIVGGRVH